MNQDDTKILDEKELESVQGGTMGPTSSEQMVDCLIQAFSDRFKVPTNDLNMNTVLRDLGADSLDVVDIVSGMQKRFNIKTLITSKVNTIGDVLNQMIKNNQ